ncbi:hypothetical protein J6590_077395 [Homalodisca vitripennis]|nr:hypothetical protein J6590_077395 [Homalodisca vitripennis]
MYRPVKLAVFGFSVGDELGFRQSLSTLESNRRRSTDTQAAPNIVTADSAEVREYIVTVRVSPVDRERSPPHSFRLHHSLVIIFSLGNGSYGQEHRECNELVLEKRFNPDDWPVPCSHEEEKVIIYPIIFIQAKQIRHDAGVAWGEEGDSSSPHLSLAGTISPSHRMVHAHFPRKLLGWIEHI